MQASQFHTIQNIIQASKNIQQTENMEKWL